MVLNSRQAVGSTIRVPPSNPGPAEVAIEGIPSVLQRPPKRRGLPPFPAGRSKQLVRLVPTVHSKDCGRTAVGLREAAQEVPSQNHRLTSWLAGCPLPAGGRGFSLILDCHGWILPESKGTCLRPRPAPTPTPPVPGAKAISPENPIPTRSTASAAVEGVSDAAPEVCGRPWLQLWQCHPLERKTPLALHRVLNTARSPAGDRRCGPSVRALPSLRGLRGPSQSLGDDLSDLSGKKRRYRVSDLVVLLCTPPDEVIVIREGL